MSMIRLEGSESLVVEVFIFDCKINHEDNL